MIFVVLGTQMFPFDRLLKVMDTYAAGSERKEEIFAQIGHSNYIPQHYEYVPFLDKESFEKRIQTCDLLITHGGIGTILVGLENKKRMIVFPRLRKHGEHIDDHQLEVANVFQKKGMLSVCGETDDLSDVIHDALNKHYAMEYRSARKENLELLESFISSVSREGN